MGEIDKGVEILVDLFIDTGDLNYIFNQGRCYEQNRRYEEAIGRFREYLVKGTRLSGEEKADAEKHIAVCQSYLAKPEVAAPSPPASAVAVPSPPAHESGKAGTPEPVASATAPVASVAATPQRPAGASTGSGLRIAGVATASVGAAALAAGVLLTLKVNSMTSDLEKPYNYSRSTDATRKDYKTLTWVSYGVGAACVASGALMYYFGWRKGRDARVDLALVPTIESGAAGAVLAGGF
jgi:hypothetical protein